MRAALAVNYVTLDREANLGDMERLIREAAAAGAELVLFAECAPTGAMNNDDPVHDLPLGEPVPGPTTRHFAALAREHGLYVGTGILEREGDVMHNTFVLLDRAREMILKYRRISPGWHGPRADLAVYRHGTDIPVVATEFGTMACLICGDIADDGLARRVAAAQPNWLLFPYTVNFDDNSWDDTRWLREFRPFYSARACAVGTTVLGVGYLADPETGESGFGGAFVFSPTGELIARKPLGQRGLLVVDLPEPDQR